MNTSNKSLQYLLILSCFGALAACGDKDGETQKEEETVVIIVDTAECTSDAECADSASGPICDLTAQTCKAGCLTDAQCTAGDQTSCDTTTKTCVKPAVVEPEGCKVDADCAGDAAGPVCNTTSGACEPKLCTTNEECAGDAAGPVCDLTTGACKAGCAADTDCTDEALPVCDLESFACVPSPKGQLIGTGDGSPGSVNLVQIYAPRTPIESTDLEFHPERSNELWVLNRQFEVQGTCTEANFRSARCESFWSTTTIIKSPGTPFQSEKELVDGNAWHFMRRAPAMAMGANDTFGTCGEAFTGNFEDSTVKFIGPSLWSSDLSIYAQDSGGNGSHLDMLHATPWCMGIAHERDNVYWVFNGDVGAIDRYDFKADHGPGNDDHSDGEIFRYVPGEVLRVPNVPSHMEFNDVDAQLYVVDTGHARIIKIDTTVGTLGGRFTPVYEPLASWGFMEGTTMTEVVVGNGLVQPSGLAIHDETLYISDHATGKLHAFDMEGNLLRSLDTGLGAGALAGITVGPNDTIWFTHMKTGAVYHIIPK